MTNRFDDAFDSLTLGIETALGDVLRVYRDGTQPVDPPCAVIAPPQIDFEAYDNAPTGLTFTLYLVVQPDDRMMSRLFDLIEPVSNAVWDNVPNAAVTSASPAAYPISDTSSLPCYQITVEMSL